MYLEYQIKPLCNSVRLYQLLPGIDVIARVITV